MMTSLGSPDAITTGFVRGAAGGVETEDSGQGVLGEEAPFPDPFHWCYFIITQPPTLSFWNMVAIESRIPDQLSVLARKSLLRG